MDTSKDEVSPATAWDPKKFVCDHNADRPVIAEKIAENSKRCEELDKKLEKNGKKLDDIEFFYEKFGDRHAENAVTLMIEDYNCRKWDLQSELEMELLEVETELSEWKRRLAKVQYDAENVDCPCLKKEI